MFLAIVDGPNYSHAILDQQIQNNGGCLEAAGTKTLQVSSDSTENKLNPIQFLLWIHDTR